MIIAQFLFRRRWLSNFYNCHVEYTTALGKRFVYKSVEHGYQAQKADNQWDHDWISEADGAAEARRRGRSLKRQRSGFDKFKRRLMLKLLWSKFYHNPHLRKKLELTWPHELVHGNMHEDLFWGVSRRTGKGENHLGQLLMFLREAIKDGTDHLIPEMGNKKLRSHARYRQNVRDRIADANLGVVVRPLPKLTHEEKMRYEPGLRKKAAQRKGHKINAMWASLVTNVKEYNEKWQAGLRREAYGMVEKLDPNRKGTSKWKKHKKASK